MRTSIFFATEAELTYQNATTLAQRAIDDLHNAGLATAFEMRPVIRHGQDLGVGLPRAGVISAAWRERYLQTLRYGAPPPPRQPSTQATVRPEARSTATQYQTVRLRRPTNVHGSSRLKAFGFRRQALFGRQRGSRPKPRPVPARFNTTIWAGHLACRCGEGIRCSSHASIACEPVR